MRPEDAPEALIVAPTAGPAGAYSGPYVAGAVWAVARRARRAARQRPARSRSSSPGAYELVDASGAAREGVLDLEAGDGRRRAYATCFTPGLAPPGA